MAGLFYSNQNNISSRFCINKAKPALKCNGKCYLSKKLKQVNPAENTNNDNQESANLRIKTDPFIIMSIQVSRWPVATLSVPFVLFAQQHYANNYAADIFHPPCSTTA
ncbi:MAG: hypothetical protein I8H66_10975 [Sphingobacteriia bacterium]|nr:hypothetical protein [Sphingobacteriia bacterium]